MGGVALFYLGEGYEIANLGIFLVRIGWYLVMLESVLKASFIFRA